MGKNKYLFYDFINFQNLKYIDHHQIYLQNNNDDNDDIVRNNNNKEW